MAVGDIEVKKSWLTLLYKVLFWLILSLNLLYHCIIVWFSTLPLLFPAVPVHTMERPKAEQHGLDWDTFCSCVFSFCEAKCKCLQHFTTVTMIEGSLLYFLLKTVSRLTWNFQRYFSICQFCPNAPQSPLGLSVCHSSLLHNTRCIILCF